MTGISNPSGSAVMIPILIPSGWYVPVSRNPAFTRGSRSTTDDRSISLVAAILRARGEAIILSSFCGCTECVDCIGVTFCDVEFCGAGEVVIDGVLTGASEGAGSLAAVLAVDPFEGIFSPA